MFIVLLMLSMSRASRAADVSLPIEDPLEVKGNLEVVGSSTITPIIRRLYKRFILEGYRGVMKLRGVGTGRGFKLFCQEGSADIVMASRPIKAYETLACATKGLTPVALTIGHDALTVVANLENNFIDDVTEKQLQTIFTVNQWSEVNDAWPQDAIQRFIPSPGSGTLNYFVDTIFNGEEDELLVAAQTAKERDPETIAQAVGNAVNGIGIIGYAFYKKSQHTLKPVSIKQVKPARETVENGDYLLTRDLLVYSDTALIRDKPQVRAFLTFLLNHVGQEIEQVGYFPLSIETLDNSKLELLGAMGIEP